MYDSLHPQLMLLSRMSGEQGGHYWIYLFSSLGLLQKSQFFGGLVHKLGALTVIAAIGWGAFGVAVAVCAARYGVNVCPLH